MILDIKFLEFPFSEISRSFVAEIAISLLINELVKLYYFSLVNFHLSLVLQKDLQR